MGKGSGVRSEAQLLRPQEVKLPVPMGGICAAAFGMSPIGGNQYCQALVKYA